MDTNELQQRIGILAINGELGPKGVYIAKELVECEAWGSIQGLIEYHEFVKRQLSRERRISAHYATYGEQI